MQDLEEAPEAMAGTASRRQFLERCLAGSGLALAGTLAQARNKPLGSQPWFETSIAELQALMARGAMSSVELTQGYLWQIARLNPLLNAVIESNHQALVDAQRLDRERAAGRVRGPLHGIPVLLKDNIATADAMKTTAGSLALRGSQVREDAAVVARLRAAGAVLLGKTNLSEWANFRGNTPPVDDNGSWLLNGWSARGGFTRNPYQLGWDTSGSSSGSAVAVAANMCAVAVGSETDGSIVSPAGNNMVVGLKPTIGLVAQAGIIPISHSQDTAGPMARTVSDCAALLGGMVSPAVAGAPGPDYLSGLRRGALRGARIGIDPFIFYNYTDPAQADVAWQAVQRMLALGATVVNVDLGDPLTTFYDAEFTVLLHEFKIDITRYLAGLARSPVRSLADLIAFNTRHCWQEMRYYGQDLFEASEATSGDPAEPGYVEARRLCLEFTRDRALRPIFETARVDAIAIPSAGWSSSHAAVAGYPNLSMPVGMDVNRRPVGLCLIGNVFAEARLLSLGFDLEQELDARVPPQFEGSPFVWPEAGLCVGTPPPPRRQGQPGRHGGHRHHGRREPRRM